MRLFIIGYQGLDVPLFIRILQTHKIARIVDVRENAISRKTGFSKNQLAQTLAENAIAYDHWRALGMPRELRHEFKKNPDWEWLSARYLDYLGTQPAQLDRLLYLASQHLVCLMCFEADPAACHRSLIADYLLHNIDPSFQVRHLTAD